MKKFLKKAALYFLLPVFAIYLGYSFNWIIGTLLVLGYIGFIVYRNLPSIYRFIGNVRYTKGDIPGAINWFGKAFKSGRAKPTTGVSLGYLHLKNGNIEESEKIFNKVLNNKPDKDVKLLTISNLALVEWKKGDLDKAIEMLEEIRNDYINSNIFGSLGYLLILKGDMDKALQFNLEAYEYNNSNSIILDNLGETYYHRGEYDKAEEIYDTLMAKNPTFPEAYYHYSLVLLEKDNRQKALETLKKALGFNFTFLSTVSKEEVERKISGLENNNN